ncbi:MAG: hypothetical protein PW786_04735 [Arachidicoccus sp.]|nr:hypothetical protein [Arachidicoccus sp.]
MRRRKISAFWIFQLAGWMGFFVSTLLTNITKLYSSPFSVSISLFLQQLMEVLEGILITALLRQIIIRTNILQKEINHTNLVHLFIVARNFLYFICCIYNY